MKPSDWGPHLWNSLHIIALGYPETSPSWQQRFNYKSHFTNFGNILPCIKCSINFKRHMDELPIDGYLDSRAKLFEWTVLLHNIVNKESKKKEWTVDEAHASIRSIMHKNDGNGNGTILAWFNVVLVVIVVFLVVYFRRRI